MQKKLILDSDLLDITLSRLCQQLIEAHQDFSETVILGLQPRGIFLAEIIHQKLEKLLKKSIPLGYLDATFHRDDFRRREIVIPSETKIDFQIEDKNVILVDDVLYTGRTIRAGMDAMIDYGRPKKVELLTLVDRRYRRHLPIAPDYIGISVDTITTEKVIVKWKEVDGTDEIFLENKIQ